MAYTVTKLISRSYNLSGISSFDFETVSGPQYEQGLDCLNDIIADKTTDQSMIPYFTEFNFPSIPGQEIYFIQNLIEATTLTFTLESVRYSMIQVGRDAYFGYPRANNVESLPFNYHVERQFLGANIYLYFIPQAVYNMQLWGKFRLASVTLNQDLELTLDRFYIDLLLYELTERLCDVYNYQVPHRVSMQLQNYRNMISKKSAVLDLKCVKISTLDDSQYGLNYGQANLGKGWTVP